MRASVIQLLSRPAILVDFFTSSSSIASFIWKIALASCSVALDCHATTHNTQHTTRNTQHTESAHQTHCALRVRPRAFELGIHAQSPGPVLPQVQS